MDFSCAQSIRTYNEAAIELVAAVFCKRLQEHHATSFVTKLNSWRRKHYKIRLDSVLYLLIHGKDKHDRLLVQIVLNGLREAP